MIYADYSYYVNCFGGEKILPDDSGALIKASRTIDTLTFCRIDWKNLTDFQKSIIKNVCCLIAEWQEENKDLLNSPYSSYSINGVSASWGNSSALLMINGEFVPRSIYAELLKTGLCYRGI